MADPFSILGLLGTAAGIANTITMTIRTLSDIRDQYRDADIRIRLLVGELSAVKSALSAIQDWIHVLDDDTRRQNDLVDGLRISLEGCKLAMDALAEEVRGLVGDALPTSFFATGFRTRTRYAWNEASMKEHEERLQKQVALLHLLLQAVQW